MSPKTTEVAYLHSERKAHKRAVVATMVVLLLLSVIVRLNLVDWHYRQFFQFNKELGLLVLNFMIGLAGSMVAAMIFMKAQAVDERNNVLRIQRVTAPAFLETFLNDLEHLEATTCSDYVVEIVFEPIIDRPDLVQVHLRYSYKKENSHRHLRFKIARIRRDLPVTSLEHNAAFFSNELYFYLDERAIFEAPENDRYGVECLLINHSLRLELTRVNPNETNVLHFETTIPENVKLNEVSISYEVRFPMERESFLAINSELPTRHMEVRLDYTKVANVMEVYNQSFISRCFGPNQMNDSDGCGKISFNYGDWLLPKNGVVFVWWRKDIPDAGQRIKL